MRQHTNSCKRNNKLTKMATKKLYKCAVSHIVSPKSRGSEAPHRDKKYLKSLAQKTICRNRQKWLE